MTVEMQKDGHVAVVTFARPPHNFADLALIEGVGAAFDAADADPAVRAIVLRSEGRVFCAGADLVNANPVADGVTGTRNPFYVAAARLFAVGKPVVAAVQGSTVGAGLGLALVADFRVASAEARFVANFVQIGFHPGFGISAVLERVIGRQRALLMALTGRRIRGEQAAEWGLVDALVPAAELDAAALALAHEIAAGAPLAVQATRRTMRGDLATLVEAQTDHELAEQAWLQKTADFAEGVRAVRSGDRGGSGENSMPCSCEGRSPASTYIPRTLGSCFRRSTVSPPPARGTRPCPRRPSASPAAQFARSRRSPP